MFLLDYFIEYNRYCNIIGIVVVLAIAYLFSKNRAAIRPRLIVSALGLQLVIALAVLRTSIGKALVERIAYYIGSMYEFAGSGISFVFGNLAQADTPWGFVFAIKVLPVIIFFGAFTALLFHFCILQRMVGAISYVIQPLLGTSGAETLCAISNSFLGQTEAPLVVKNYLKTMTQSEIMVVMISGMATISGSILVVFAAMGVPATHLLAASVMGIPSSLLISKILLPETQKPVTLGDTPVVCEQTTANAFDAISQGTSDGLSLCVNVAAMLIAFIAFLAMGNSILGFISEQTNTVFAWMGWDLRIPLLSLQFIFGYLFAPFGYLLGFTGDQALLAGQLLGTKVGINELIAYGQMVSMHLPERMVNIMTYALCGFSNFSCIGIQIGGIGALVPEKRHLLTKFGLYAVLGGALSNVLSAMIAGLLL